MDEEWYLLLEVGNENVEVNSRIIHASKKDGEDCYVTQLEFLDLTEESAVLLQNLQ